MAAEWSLFVSVHGERGKVASGTLKHVNSKQTDVIFTHLVMYSENILQLTLCDFIPTWNDSNMWNGHWSIYNVQMISSQTDRRIDENISCDANDNEGTKPSCSGFQLDNGSPNPAGIQSNNARVYKCCQQL